MIKFHHVKINKNMLISKKSLACIMRTGEGIHFHEKTGCYLDLLLIKRPEIKGKFQNPLNNHKHLQI